MTLNIGIVIDKESKKVQNHRSLLKVLLNPFLRMNGLQIVTDYDYDNNILRKSSITSCPIQFDFSTWSYKMKDNHMLIKKRCLI